LPNRVINADVPRCLLPILRHSHRGYQDLDGLRRISPPRDCLPAWIENENRFSWLGVRSDPSVSAHPSNGSVASARPIMRRRHFFKTAVLVPCLAAELSGCAVHGAPSFVMAGSYFPGWMFCALIGILAAIAVRVCFVASGLVNVLPLQLFVCAAVGLSCGLLAWLLWFGQ